MAKWVDRRMSESMMLLQHLFNTQIYFQHCSAFYTMNNILDTQMLLKSYNIFYVMLTMNWHIFDDINLNDRKMQKQKVSQSYCKRNNRHIRMY